MFRELIFELQVRKNKPTLPSEDDAFWRRHGRLVPLR
jgi:hypothetical protein